MKSIEKVYLEKNNYRLREAVEDIYTKIGLFLSDYFKNQKSEKTYIYSRIAENINNENKLKDELSGLNKLIIDINKYAEIENLSSFYNQISTFIHRNIDLIKNPNKNNNNINKKFKDQLRGLAARIICRGENIMATLFNTGTTYFIMYNEKYEECLRTKNI